jgi:nitrate/nitrite transporter NarK
VTKLEIRPQHEQSYNLLNVKPNADLFLVYSITFHQDISPAIIFMDFFTSSFCLSIMKAQQAINFHNANSLQRDLTGKQSLSREATKTESERVAWCGVKGKAQGNEIKPFICEF